MIRFMFLTYDEQADEFEVKELTKHEFILITLKRLQEASFSDLRKATKLEKSTLHKALQQLRKGQYINFRRDHTNQIGRPKIIYQWNKTVEIPTIKDILKGV